MQVHTLETTAVPGRTCTHEVAVPPGFNFTGAVFNVHCTVHIRCTYKLTLVTLIDHIKCPGLREPTREPAKNYKFTLDPFQSQSILCIENDQVSNS